MSLATKIQVGKLSMILLGSLVIGVRRFFFGREASQMYALVIERDECSPSLGKGTPKNTLINATGNFCLKTIATILSIRTLSKIFSSVVQSVVIPVVAFFSSFAPGDDSVHSDGFSICTPVNVEILGRWTPIRGPVPLRKPVEVLNVDNRVLSLRQWDKSVRFIEWLNNFVSDNTLLGHVLPPSRMCFSRYFSTGGALSVG